MNPFQSNPISFPGLGIMVNPPGTAFTVFGIDVQWYGLIITIGFLLAILYGLQRAPEFGVGRDPLIDVLLFAVPSALIGARAYYVLFNLSYYKENPLRILNFREGGLAIYGAVLLGFLAAILVSRFKKIRPAAVLDLGSLGFLIGQAIGRWGNFTNREAFGSETMLPWRMRLTYGGMFPMSLDVHPCFLYESLWNLLGFLILHLYSPKRRYDGEIFLMYIAWYGAGRGAIEILRADSLYIPGTNIPVSMVLGFASAAIAIAILIFNRMRSRAPEEMQLALYRAALSAVSEAESPENSALDSEEGASAFDFSEAPAESEPEISEDTPETAGNVSEAPETPAMPEETEPTHETERGEGE